MRRALAVVLLFVSAIFCVTQQKHAFAQAPPPAPASTNHLSDPFATGWMLADTNGDGIADEITGKIVVPDHPTAAENAAAANLAARFGYGSTGLTLPLVLAAPESPAEPRIWIGRAAPDFVSPLVPSNDLKQFVNQFEKGKAAFSWPVRIWRSSARMMPGSKQPLRRIRLARLISGKFPVTSFRQSPPQLMPQRMAPAQSSLA